jgi:phosphonopyruvate decarboxylase
MRILPPVPVMIEAQQFIEAARVHGFEWYAGVPCSYLTPFINYVLQDPSLHYLSMANEGDAVALIAGVALAGDVSRPHRRGIAMLQNSGLGNAVSPLTSLTWTFRLPQLLIVTWRGQPGVPDEPQHALMGQITPAILETMDIPWEMFPTDAGAIEPALQRATAHMDATGRPYCLLMQKESVAACPLEPGAAVLTKKYASTSAVIDGKSMFMESRPSRTDALRVVVAHTPGKVTAVLASTGFCGRELWALHDRPNQFYMVGSMGCLMPLALGLALARPDLRVVALDGDGAALMRLGAFATVGAYGPPNLMHLLIDNGVHDSTGGQSTVSPVISFADIAAACGYASSLETDDVSRIAAWLDEKPLRGSRFARLLSRPGSPDGLPRPSTGPEEVKKRLMNHFRPGEVQ